MNLGDGVRIEPMGDNALLLHFGDTIDLALNARVHETAALLRAARLPGVVDIVPAYASVLLRFDPLAGDGAGLEQALCSEAGAPPSHEKPHGSSFPRTRESIFDLPKSPLDSLGGNDEQEGGAATAGRLVEIPVCYGGEHGPDLDELAAHAKRSRDEAIALHGGAHYRVAMLGFAPGFPYLLGLPAALHAPRRASPRTRVPAGSVAIGGAQTGIYPRELPGGWQLIGRTPLALFDLARDPPTLLAPGDRVHFRAIDADEFAALSHASADAAPARAWR